MTQPIPQEKLQQIAEGLLTDLTPAQLQEMADLYRRRYSSKKIAAQFKVSGRCVLQVLRKLSVEIRRGGAQTVLTPEIKAEAKRLLGQGTKQLAVAAIVGVSHSTIRDAISRGDL